ncbi:MULTISPECIES: ABC transporter permease [unclassified Haladaptatus]|uniref:ABC transporter permease n=1 Tax=unclassified Haladaptatus TaxID=2622732 RepID=UPI00209BC23E|nr:MULTISPECIES: ABC transporter permease [unclassified Haladaptatus]MCO8245273.1 ABC transporter permease [Haladaptatus sp. AB643]MCO8256603.1 ABC transporter permease [Haladaptatus sp. AB618]
MNLRYLVKRATYALATVYLAVSLSFFLIRMLPGGPETYIKNKLMQSQTSMSVEQINHLAAAYTNVYPDQPLYVQYINYMTSALHGDFGTSVWFGEPVSHVIWRAMPWTLFLSTVTLFLGLTIGVVVGGLMAYKEGGKFDVGVTSYTLIAGSIPYYMLAIVLVYVLGFMWGIFPTNGAYASGLEPGFNIPFMKSVVYHAVLPVLSMVFVSFGGTALGLRSNAISELGSDYIRAARIRALPQHRIALRYVARNAILPMYTGIMMGIASIFGGSIILEQIFGYQGIGYIMFKATMSRDYPLMMGSFILVTVATVTGIFIADITYGMVDPRIETGGEGRESY